MRKITFSQFHWFPHRNFATSNSSENLYEKLGVLPNATQEEIKAAFIQKAKAYHPDTRKGNDPESVKKFIEIREAYEILRDPEKRRQYDFRANINTARPPYAENMSYTASRMNTNYTNYYTREQQQYQQARENFYKYYNVRRGYPYNFDTSRHHQTSATAFQNTDMTILWLLIFLYGIVFLYGLINRQKKLRRRFLVDIAFEAKRIGHEIPHVFRPEQFYRAVSFKQQQNQKQQQQQQQQQQHPLSSQPPQTPNVINPSASSNPSQHFQYPLRT
jgi:curved DNA-binding protein CbpA